MSLYRKFSLRIMSALLALSLLAGCGSNSNQSMSSLIESKEPSQNISFKDDDSYPLLRNPQTGEVLVHGDTMTLEDVEQNDPYAGQPYYGTFLKDPGSEKYIYDYKIARDGKTYYLLVTTDPTNGSSAIAEISDSSLIISKEEAKSIKTEPEEYRAIAYVTVPASENWRWEGTENSSKAVSDVDTELVTNIHFAFGQIEAYQFDPKQKGRPLMIENDGAEIVSPEAYKDSDGNYHYRATLDGWIEEMGAAVSGGKYLKALTQLKEKKPDLKVLLTIGGADADGFCYMSRTREGRKEFIESLIGLVREYELDGIDLNWECPTNGGWNTIAWCENCVSDANRLLMEMRSAFTNAFPNESKLICATVPGTQPWVNKTAFSVLDYLNVMCFDADYKDKTINQASLDSAKSGMLANVNLAGDYPFNRTKINLGVPFYNGAGPALVPYRNPWDGYITTDPDILEEKMQWLKENGYGGAFYWAYSMDDSKGSLRNAVYNGLNGK